MSRGRAPGNGPGGTRGGGGTDAPLDRDRELLTAALDDELEPEERRMLERRLEEDPELRREWKEMRKMRELTGRMRLREPPEEVWDRYWLGVYRRLERGLAWLLVAIGAVLLLAYGLFEIADDLLSDPALPGFVKVGVVLLALGLVVLAVSVAREKIFVWRRDPYRDVRR